VTQLAFNSWQAVHDEVLRRIHARVWPPGTRLPNEAELAQTFGCARVTVNRALQALAEAGIVERRRKAGTHVALHPIRKATLSIPILRHEIEATGRPYGYRLLEQGMSPAPRAIADRLRLRPDARPMHLRALHLAGDAPYAFEDRWINTATVPTILQADLTRENANEWLLAHAPFTDGEVSLGAANATTLMAQALGCAADAALFEVERVTWDGPRAITFVSLTFAPGYRMRTVF